MAVETGERSGSAIEVFAELGGAAALGSTLDEAADAVVAAAAAATGAEVVVARVLDEALGQMRARSVAATSLALAAELEGSLVPVEEVPRAESDEPSGALRRVGERAGAPFALVLPIRLDGRLAGTLELLRARSDFAEPERRIARLAAGELALAVRAFGGPGAAVASQARAERLEVAGEALAAAADEARTADQVVRLAAAAAGAVACLLWRTDEGGGLPLLLARHGEADPGQAVEAVERALRRHEPLALEAADGQTTLTLQLGQPPLGALQVRYAGDGPSEDARAALAAFGVRAAQALRASRRAREVSQELDRTRALLQVVGQAISQLSLAHTLTTAIDRVGELLEVERVGIYLLDGQRLTAAAGRAIQGAHVELAERLLELGVGRYRARGLVAVDDAASDPRLADVRDAVAATGIEAVLALPLLVREETIGLLAVYPPRGRVFAENELALVAALATQLAVAVQNAQLHEQAKQLGAELEQVLQSERQAGRRLRALYEISRSFAQTLSLEATLDAVASTLVEAVDVDAAVIRMMDARNDSQVLQAVHVRDAELEPALRTIFAGYDRTTLQRQLRRREPLMLDAVSVAELGSGHALLAPFLEKGSSAVLLPIATPAEALALVTLVSLDPVHPLDAPTLEIAQTIADQAALAIDNARLYQQQKQFADTMQRSLLPRALPEAEGLELGDVYESSARVDVGGDVYDYLVLDDGRLAVALGDVTGHGIDAAADMAMAKFVFRSLAREHPEPGDFLAHANDVVVGEIALGKFITMSYLVVDRARGLVRCASAGHPAPRLVRPDGAVTGLEATGLALGIDAPQEYAELEAPLEPGAAVVVYTDGVVEARRDGELFGVERLDAVLAARQGLPAREIALAVLEECRRFGEGELADDCAVVVIKRTA